MLQLLALQAEILGEHDPSSYITVNLPLPEGDAFSHFIIYRMASLFHRLLGRRLQAGRIIDEVAQLRSCSDSKLDKASNVIAVIVASTMPVLTIFVLNSVQYNGEDWLDRVVYRPLRWLLGLVQFCEAS
jgi:hypothetical protein